MSDFHALRVKDVRRETADTVSVAIDVPDHLVKLFAYKQGQYLTFKKKIFGEEIRRSYSLCSSPVTDNEWRIAIKKVEKGKFSAFANNSLRAGDALEVMSPQGKFYTEVAEGQKKNYMAFASGSGITPVISILKTILAVEKESTFTLYYGNRDLNSVIFKKELEELKSANSGRFNLYYVFSRQENPGDFHGRISAGSCEEFSKQNENFYKADEYFICGPEEMIFGIKGMLTQKGIDAGKIHFELFSTPVHVNESKKDVIQNIDSDVTVVIDGETFNFTLNTSGNSILDEAMNQGADVPFSCKGAVCCTCRAKVMEGSVHMEMNYALTDGEVDDGYVLTCQSHPTSAKVVIDYDED